MHPVEPAADIRAFANLQFQTFVALVAEGFTEKQALAIIGNILAAAMIANQGDEDK